jgi:hypothetical protein
LRFFDGIWRRWRALLPNASSSIKEHACSDRNY